MPSTSQDSARSPTSARCNASTGASTRQTPARCAADYRGKDDAHGRGRRTHRDITTTAGFVYNRSMPINWPSCKRRATSETTDDYQQENRDAERTRTRMALIDAEVNAYLVVAEQREQSVSNKASFLAVTAGVVITATIAQTWCEFAAWGIASMVAAFASITLATIALRPGTRPGDTPRTLMKFYLDTDKSERAVRLSILVRKADAARERENALRCRGRIVLAGFIALVFSCLALTVGVIQELAPRMW